MLLYKIVNKVNSKSFGETTYTYEDIQPYFQEAIDNLNSQLDSYRHIPDAPVLDRPDDVFKTEYSFLSDMHINTYVVTYIVVAMDNASLAVTSRTSAYNAQLTNYTQRIIGDLYKFMPVNGASTNSYFDVGYSNRSCLNKPNVRIWYNESVGGKLSAYGGTAPNLTGIQWDNPYGTVVISPKYKDYKLKEGINEIVYIFYPNTYFSQFYEPKAVLVPIVGYRISHIPPTYIGEAEDIGVYSSLNKLLYSAWLKLKNADGTPNIKSSSLLVGLYTETDGKIYSVQMSQANTGIRYFDMQHMSFFDAVADDNAQPNKFTITKVMSMTGSCNLTDIEELIDAKLAKLTLESLGLTLATTPDIETTFK